MRGLHSRPRGRERQDLLDVRRSRGEHQRAVEAERHTGTIRKAAGERGEQPLIGRDNRQTEPPPLRVVALEARPLLVRRRQLVKAVGELDAIAVQLEAPRRARLARIEARQRRLGRRITVDESQRLAAEPRADERTHEQLEPHVAVGAGAREPERLRDRKSTRLNSSHGYISYAVFCLKKKTRAPNTWRATCGRPICTCRTH